ncbi:MAG: Rieske 2Fe-2S domain-containing protein [Vicinamibacterales bacterium]
MKSTHPLTHFVDHPAIDKIAKPISKAVRGGFEAAGPVGQQAKNALHGVWLGHPLHPVFTDIPIGAWTTALALDAAGKNDAGMRRAATFAMGVGLLGAMGAAASGLTDWSETGGRSRRVGLVHGLLNMTATALFAAAYVARKKTRSHNRGRASAWAGYGLVLGAAYLGGDLVYSKRVGVTHADVEAPEEFTPAIESASVAEGTMARGRAGDADVLVTRQHGRVCALIHACSHLGGPLSEGTLKDDSVVCPWHGSEFALESGEVLNGPATEPQPCLETRERDGHIEVKLAPGSTGAW